MDAVIQERKTRKDDFHVGGGAKIGAFFKDRGVDLLNVFSGALTVRDDVVRAFVEEVRLYESDQYVADRIRRPLERELMRAWEEGRKVAVISHSMGTFVAYDVLWRFAHRTTSPTDSKKKYSEYRKRKVDYFVTMGSPLGNKTSKDLLFASRYRGEERFFPTNIVRWDNFACLGDVVSHDSTLEDDFHKAMQDKGLLQDARDYVQLYNPYVSVDNKRNPHKSYGYLVQPKLAKWIHAILG